MSNRDPYYVHARATVETAKALLCEIGDDEVWIPKSQILDDSEVIEKGDEGNLAIPEWLAIEKGIA